MVSKLHVEGKYIKDDLGRIVYLRGDNQEGMLNDPNGWWNPEGGGVYTGLRVWNPDAVKYNLDRMKDWGCNVVRLHTNVEWWLENPNDYRQHIKDVITWAAQRGIYVIFEFYSVQAGTGQDQLPFPPYSLSGSETIIPDVATFVDIWRSVANELKEFPNIIFELWNEPVGGDTPDDWFNCVEQCIATIREITDHIIIVQWGYDVWTNLSYPPPTNPAGTLYWITDSRIQGVNVVFSFHHYRGNIHDSEAPIRNSYTYDDLKRGLQICLVEEAIFTHNKPIIVGEVGANMWWTGDDLVRELEYYKNSLTIFNEWGISYVGWVWRDTVTGLKHGLLKLTDDKWYCDPNEAGQILMEALAIAPPPIPPILPTITPFIFGGLLIGLSEGVKE